MPKKKSKSDEKRKEKKTSKKLKVGKGKASAAQGKSLKKSKTSSPDSSKKKNQPAISFEEISLRAYFIAERRSSMGWSGDETSDWVEAERQLLAEAAQK